MAINDQNKTADFSNFTNDVEKETFVRYLIHKQFELGKFMVALYADSNIFHDYMILIALRKNLIFWKIYLIDWTEQWHLLVFLWVMDEYFKWFFSFSDKISRKKKLQKIIKKNYKNRNLIL